MMVRIIWECKEEVNNDFLICFHCFFSISKAFILDFNRIEEGFDRRNFGSNRFNAPIRGANMMGRGSMNQFNPRMPPHFMRGPRPGKLIST